MDGKIQQLFEAVKAGDGARAAALLQNGADPNAAKVGRTALVMAAERGDWDMVGTLLRWGAEADGEWAYELASQLDGGKDYPMALALYLKAEKSGITCGAELGFLYRWGRGTPRDDREAARWFERDAVHGITGRLELGLMYWLGEGVGRNEARAAELLGRAPDHPVLLAEERFEIDTEDDRSERLYRALEEHGLRRFECSDGGIAAGWTFDIHSDYAAMHGFRRDEETGRIRIDSHADDEVMLALQWLRTEADEGNADAQFSLGLLALLRYGDRKNGERWLAKALLNGREGATAALARLATPQPD